MGHSDDNWLRAEELLLSEASKSEIRLQCMHCELSFFLPFLLPNGLSGLRILPILSELWCFLSHIITCFSRHQLRNWSRSLCPFLKCPRGYIQQVSKGIRLMPISHCFRVRLSLPLFHLCKKGQVWTGSIVAPLLFVTTTHKYYWLLWSCLPESSIL